MDFPIQSYDLGDVSTINPIRLQGVWSHRDSLPIGYLGLVYLPTFQKIIYHQIQLQPSIVVHIFFLWVRIPGMCEFFNMLIRKKFWLRIFHGNDR